MPTLAECPRGALVRDSRRTAWLQSTTALRSRPVADQRKVQWDCGELDTMGSL